MVVDEGIVPILVKTLESSSDEVKEHVLRCIGNISAHTSEMIDIFIDCGAIAPIIEIYNTNEQINVKKNGARALAKLCSEDPAPDFEKVRHCVPCLSHFIMN